MLYMWKHSKEAGTGGQEGEMKKNMQTMAKR